MEHPDFEAFHMLRGRGLRADAKAAMDRFLAAMQTPDAKREEWVRANLHRFYDGFRARMDHRLWVGVVLPVLRAGWRKDDLWSIINLARFADNWTASDGCEGLENTTRVDLWRHAYNLDPGSDEARLGLADVIKAGLDYALHEWPSGLTLGEGETNQGLVEDLTQDLALLRLLDIEKARVGACARYRTILNEARERYF